MPICHNTIKYFNLFDKRPTEFLDISSYKCFNVIKEKEVSDTMDAKKYNRYFGQYIRSLRESLKLSQVEAAKRLNISQSYLHRLETGDRNPDLGVAVEMCEILGSDIIDFAKKYIYVSHNEEVSTTAENPHEES